MGKFISFILDKKRVKAYFGSFFILLTNFIFIFLSILIVKNNNEFINEHILTTEDRIISILLSFHFFYIVYFNIKNNIELKKSFFHKYTKLSIYIFLVIFYLKSISFTDFSFFYFFLSFSYLIILNILIKNKRLAYYLMLIFIFFLSIFFSFASLVIMKQNIEKSIDHDSRNEKKSKEVKFNFF